MIEKLTDTPKYVRYDFFMALLGIFIAYATYTNNNLYNEILMRFLLLIISVVCTLYGIVEMKKNYEKDKEVQDIEYAYTKQRLIRDLLLLEKS